MEGDFIKINEALKPLSWVYGMAVGLRNFCFEVGILKSHSFSVPVISVGNITVGGTGKTPHVEFLVNLLKDKFHVAVLSRGYKRKSSGFLKAEENSTAKDIGDEPRQMHLKFPNIIVAVDKKRVRGIERLTEEDQQLDVILLDDAFQHRYVKPGVNILLVDYHRLIIYDKLLPAGRLREPLSGKNRADIVIITKCPKGLKPMDFRVITKAMDLYPYQHLYYTSLQYDDLVPLFPAAKDAGASLPNLQEQNVLLLAGIASPQHLIEDLSPNTLSISPLTFPDHHTFTRKDIKRINQAFADLPSPKCIITTEKDAARLLQAEGLSADVQSSLFVLPVKITFIQPEQEEKFKEYIIGYVRKNSRNSILAKAKDEQQARDGNRSGDRTRTISFRHN